MAMEFSNGKVIADLNDRISIRTYKWNSNCGEFWSKQVGENISLFLGEGIAQRIMVTKGTHKFEGQIIWINKNLHKIKTFIKICKKYSVFRMNSILICHCLPIPVFICYVKEVVVFNQDESRLKKVILRHDILFHGKPSSVEGRSE